MNTSIGSNVWKIYLWDRIQLQSPFFSSRSLIRSCLRFQQGSNQPLGQEPTALIPASLTFLINGNYRLLTKKPPPARTPYYLFTQFNCNISLIICLTFKPFHLKLFPIFFFFCILIFSKFRHYINSISLKVVFFKSQSSHSQKWSVGVAVLVIVVVAADKALSFNLPNIIV